MKHGSLQSFRHETNSPAAKKSGLASHQFLSGLAWPATKGAVQCKVISSSLQFFALNGAFCGWPGRGERLLRAKLFQGGAGAQNQVQSRAEYRCTLLFSSAISQ